MRTTHSVTRLTAAGVLLALSFGCEAGSSGAKPDSTTALGDVATGDTASGDVAVDPLDVVTSDVPVALDVPAPGDVPAPSDVPAISDTPAPEDVPTLFDVPFPDDTPAPQDLPPPEDVPWLADVSACPVEQPVPGGACSAPGLECSWGTETCCGVTHPSFVCSCSGGSWGCYYTDACFGPVDLLCPDTVSGDTTSGDTVEPDVTAVDAGPAPDVVVPEGPTRLVEAGWSFGMCASGCVGTLAFQGASIDLTVESPGGVIDFMASGILTTGGAANLDSILSALDGVPLDSVYGCPDCADGGAKTIVLSRGETLTSHQYEFSNPPAVLAELDALIFAAADGLKTCTTSEAVVVLGQCPASIP